MTKVKKIKDKTEDLFDNILKDQAVRKAIVTKRFDFFFPVYFSKRLEFETPPFHEEIFHILEDESISLAVILAFRGSAKSTLISIAYVLWAIFGIQQKKFVVLISQTEAKTRSNLMNIRRQLEGNELLRKDLGPFDEEKGPWGATALTIRKLDAKIMTASVGQSIRGVLHDEHRPDLIIIDDAEDLESVSTQEGRDKLFNWINGDVLPAGSKKTRVIVIGNLLHDDGLIRRLQKSIADGRPNSVYREYPIIDENGDSLWPGKYPTPADIEQERLKFDKITWVREFLLKIISTEDQLIQRDWIQYYDGLPPEENSYCATGIDLAISKNDQADYTAMVSARVCGSRKNLKVYILPNIINKKLTFLETIDQAELISDSMGRSKLFIEEVGYQPAVTEQLRSDGYPAEGSKIHGLDKSARLNAVSHLIQSGRVVFPRGSEILVNQLLGFGIEKHDDLVDALSILLSKIIEKDSRPVARAVQIPDSFKL